MMVSRRSTLIVTRGLPGAGKTTRALRWVAEDPEHRARVGTDQIAAMLHPHVLTSDAAYTLHYAQREQLVRSGRQVRPGLLDQPGGLELL